MGKVLSRRTLIAPSIELGGTAVGATAAELNTACDLSANGALVRMKKIHVAAGAISTEQDSAWDLPAKAQVLDVFIDVTTAQSGKTLNVGLLSSESGGDADGFLAAVSLATTGLKRGGVTVTVGGTETYYSANTRGVLLSTFKVGTDGAKDFGVYNEKPHLSDSVTAKSLTYTGSASTTTAVFDIYIRYVEIG